MIGLDNLKIRKKETKINIFFAWEIEIMIMVLTKTVVSKQRCYSIIKIESVYLKNNKIHITKFI